MDRQADRRKVAFTPLGLRLRQQPALGREAECECHAERNGLTVQQPIRKAGRGLKCMAESMAEIEQCTLPALALVTRYNRRFHTTAHRDRMLARRAAGKNFPPIRLQPSKEAGISYQPVFGDFGITSTELARRKCVERRATGDPQQRLLD